MFYVNQHVQLVEEVNDQIRSLVSSNINSHCGLTLLVDFMINK